MAQLNIPKFFNKEAELLLKAREECVDLHGSDIRAAGNQVEIAVREWLTRLMPKSVSIGHGHIIDINSNISPQLDCIICDNKGISTLFRAKDKTEYTPMDSAYAIGEIKSTYYESHKYIQNFGDIINKINTELERKLQENTAANGLTKDALLHHLLHSSTNKYLNRLFAFAFFVNSGDATVEKLKEIYRSTPDNKLPNVTVFLNGCIVIKASLDGEKMNLYKYPEDAPESAKWYILPMPRHEGSDALVEGKHLGFLFYLLMNHINESLLEKPNVGQYLKDLLIGSKSSIIAI
jgi:hypothetical protein